MAKNRKPPEPPAETKNNTEAVEQKIKGAENFGDSMEALEGRFAQKSVCEYFRGLLSGRNLSSAEVVRLADLDKDFGRQILNGERGTRRDNYIRLGIAMGLGFHEMQSMLKFLQTGQIYVMRQRDAAIMFCIQKKYSLIDTQLFLDEYGFEPLGDGGFHQGDDVPLKGETQALETKKVEQIIMSAAEFDEVLDKTEGKLIKATIEKYFDDLLERKNIQKKELFARAKINPNIGYQLLRGTRKSKNRDTYLKIAIEAGLSLDETQTMLKLLNAGAIYPVIERDAVVFYGMTHGYSLARIQALLEERGLLPL